MDFRILGPLEVLDDGRTLDLGGAKQRATLAMLALHANRVVAHERLIEALWDEKPPDTARKALQVYVSQLRKVLGRERLETKPRGYLLRIGPEELDLSRFELLRDSGKPEQALAQWRGEPLADFADQRFAEPEIARLEELRLACVEQRIELDLADGRHTELIGELEALVRLHPLSEHLRAQLMLALYRSGRQAEALEAYQAARTALVDGLGIEPGPALRGLHQRILTQDPELDLAAPQQPPRSEPQLASARAEPPAQMAEARKTVTVLFCDLADSTELGERLDPESLRGLMARWYGAMREPVERHGGTVEKFIGDAVMAVFGIPSVHEDDAFRAVRAAVEMREALARLNEELAGEERPQLRIRIGVNSGEVVTGDHDTTLVTGDAVNTAKRLEEAAEPDEILIGDQTRRLVENAAVLEPSAAVEAKGKRKPVEAWRVLGTIEGAAPFARRTDTPIVDRVAELGVLRSELAAAERERSCRLVTVLGTAGLGKSRLASELMEEVLPRATVLTARCLPYGDGITFWPLLELLSSVGGDDALAEAVRDEPDRELIRERMSALTGSAAPSSPEETFWAVRRVLEALAQDRPLVLQLEDIHWAEPTLLDLVEYVVGWCRDAAILVLCLARPELLDERPDWLGVRGTSLTLEPLTGEESDELLDMLDVPLEAGARARIRDAAEGNPLFVEQMVAMLAEAPGETAMPPTINALLAARLDRLAPLDRSILERASVLGKEFGRGGVAELSPPEERNAVGTVLLSLTRRDLIEPGRTPIPGDDGFRFRHALIRDAAYSGVPKAVRAGLHERAAVLFESQGVAGELVGYHLEQTYRYRDELGAVDDATRAIGARAGELLGDAGRRAFAQEDMPAAINLLDRALRLSDPADPSRLELQRELSMALWWSGEIARAEALLDELIEAAAEAGDAGQQWSGLVERAARRNLAVAGEAEADELLRVAGEAIPVFEALRDSASLARAWRRIAYAHQMRLRYGAAEEAALLALPHARAAADAQEEARIVDGLCTILLYGPAPTDEAVARCAEMLEQERDSQVVEADVSISLAGLLAMQGRFDEARAAAERSHAVYTELGLRLSIAGWTQVAGPLELLAGDPAAAERHLRVGLEILEGGAQGYQEALLAEALYQLGSLDEAARFADLACATSAPDDVAAQVIASEVSAKVEARRFPERTEQALSSARAAASLAAATDALNLWGDSLVSVADVLQSAGRDGEARAVLDQAAGVFLRKGNIAAAARVSPERAAR
jgi:class 3 adenylate cyclase/tetratricopeptide (TPR) repeat protein